jgi:hypothetical protein
MYYFQQSFFDQLVHVLGRHIVLFHAIHEQRVVSSELALIAESYLYCFLGGTLVEGLNLRANPQLRHLVNCWAHAHQKRYVVLGGGYAANDGLFRYKQRFAPNTSLPFCVGTRILDHPSYDSLIDCRGAWEGRQGRTWSPRPDFFPAYRG